MRYFSAVCLAGALCGGLLAMGVMGCGGSTTGDEAVRVDWTLDPDPPRVGPATFTLTLSDSTGAPITGADVAVEGNMAHAGMRPVFADATEADSGRYVAPIEFTMAGDWFMTVDAALPNGDAVERTIPVRGVQPSE